MSLLIHKVKYKIRIGHRLSGEKLLNSFLLGSENLKSIFLQIMINDEVKTSLCLNKLELNLGAIPKVQFEMQFNQRLAQAFAQSLARERSAAGVVQRINLHNSDSAKPQGYSGGHLSNENELFRRAIGCLQSTTLKSLLQDCSVNQLQQLLKQLLLGGWQSPQMLPACWSSRVTSSRLSIAAVLYLLNSWQGHDWLMNQYAPTVCQVTDWTKSIAQGEIPSGQVEQLFNSNPPSGSILPRKYTYPPLVVMRWLLPLWQQPAVRRVIHRLKGELGVQRVDTYLSRCLQSRDKEAMWEEKGIQPVSGQVASPHENTVLSQRREMGGDTHQITLSRDNITMSGNKGIQLVPRQFAPSCDNTMLSQSHGMESSTLQDNAMLSECEKIRITHGTIPSGKDSFCSSYQGISNAGLLLLWPLLPQLFSLLKLCEEGLFISDTTRQQAVYSLDRLVWGEIEPAEERLTLNQMLCGVPSLLPVSSTASLSPVQLQQIDDWLIAIGQQLTAWKKLSLTDIRQLFLQRAGEIDTEGVFPQINVRPEPYDFLLRDWSWPMTLASFPWTDQPLTIVWPMNGFTG